MKVSWRVGLLALMLTQLARLQLKSADHSCNMSQENGQLPARNAMPTFDKLFLKSRTHCLKKYPRISSTKSVIVLIVNCRCYAQQWKAGYANGAGLSKMSSDFHPCA